MVGKKTLGMALAGFMSLTGCYNVPGKYDDYTKGPNNMIYSGKIDSNKVKYWEASSAEPEAGSIGGEYIMEITYPDGHTETFKDKDKEGDMDFKDEYPKNMKKTEAKQIYSKNISKIEKEIGFKNDSSE